MFKRILFSIFAFTMLVAIADDCPVIPRPRFYQANGSSIALPEAEKMAIVIASNANQTISYAAERLQTTLGRLTGRKVAICDKAPADAALVIRMGLPAEEEDIAEACRKAKFDISQGSWGYDGFLIHFNGNTVYLASAEPRAIIYAQETLCALIKRVDGKHSLTVAEIRDHAGIQWRSYSWNACVWYNEVNLDAYVDARMNCIELRDGFEKDFYGMYGYPYNYPITGEKEIPVIAAAHRRGMFVWGVVSCSAEEKNYPQIIGQVKRLIELKVDGIYISFDDPGDTPRADILVRQIMETAQKHGITGERVAILPPYPDYSKFYSDFNIDLLQQVPETREATWFLTASPSNENLKMLHAMGVKGKYGWFFNWPMGHYDMPSYQRPFFFERAYLPLGDFDDFDRGLSDWMDDEMLDNAEDRLSSVMVWTREYPETLAQFFGAWAWNPGATDTQTLRRRAYTRLYGEELADKVTEFDHYLASVNHNLTFICDYWSKCVWRIKDTRNRRHVNYLLGEMKKLAAEITAQAPQYTWIDPEHLKKEYLTPMLKTVAWLDLLVNTTFPEELLGDFREKYKQACEQSRKEEFLQEVRKTLIPMLDDIEKKFGRQRHVPGYLKMWRERLALCEKNK